MKKEYDFRNGVRGKYAKMYKDRVRFIEKQDKESENASVKQTKRRKHRDRDR